MVHAEVRRTAITDTVSFSAAELADAIAKVAFDKYSEGFSDGAADIAATVAESLETAAGTNEAYRLQLEAVQAKLTKLTDFNMADEDVITRGRMLALETLHYAFYPIMEGEGLGENEPANVLLYTPAQIIYANGFLSMITLHALRLTTVDSTQARMTMVDAIEEADKVMMTTETLGLDMDRDKLNPSA